VSRREAILGWWFEGADERLPIQPGTACYQRWFRGGAAVDSHIAEHFGGDVQAARAGACDGWAGEARGELALILLLDQFPRHIWRGRPEAFASDRAAYDLALACIAAGRDEQLALFERIFVYLPIQHSERLEDHALAFERFRALAERGRTAAAGLAGFLEGAIGEEQDHYDTLLRFGRYPYRNAALGRPSTPEELAWLAQRK
jgi:uncharacterized protein (DUF924 family)